MFAAPRSVPRTPPLLPVPIAYIAVILLILLGGKAALATIIAVPADQPSVQAGIDSAATGDTVLVAPGTYTENIDFRGKALVVTSHFLFQQDPSYILNTILNGGNPQHPDTASVVRIVGSLIDSTAVLQGFTIANGTGTKWQDEHGFGLYREGGGILCAASSPVIRFNLITDNDAISQEAGLISSGGGAIRSGDGNPRIMNNIIINNRGRYGAGIVINFGFGVIKNNVIAFNTGGEDFGGSGIWKYGYGGEAIVENNTIVGNESVLAGGGIHAWQTAMRLRNNIVWENTSPTPTQIRVNGADVTVEYCNVQGGFPGNGNINLDPQMFGDYLLLLNSSPCVDAGDPDVILNDREDPNQADSAWWPSFGTLRNDMGVYGGPDAFSFEPIVVYNDTSLGWAPLEVNFRGFTQYPAQGWLWDFGDGDTASGIAVSHIYQTGGYYDIGVDIDTGGGTVSVVKSGLVVALADTLKPEHVVSGRGQIIDIPIYANNAAPLTELIIPFEFSGSLNATYLDFTTDGCRTSYFENQSYRHFDIGNDHSTVELKTTSTPLTPGQGPVLKLQFAVPYGATEDQTAEFEVDGYSVYTPEFSGPLAEYAPVTAAGTLSVICCVASRGNADDDIFDEVNVADLSFLVDYLFLDGPAPACESEGNADGIENYGSPIDVADLAYLVRYLFFTGPPPPPCA